MPETIETAPQAERPHRGDALDLPARTSTPCAGAQQCASGLAAPPDTDGSTDLTSVEDLRPEELGRILHVLSQVRQAAARDPRFGFDVPWQQFANYMRLLTPQSYGARFQNRLAEFYRWEVVSASMERGDVRALDGKYYEVKVSVMGGANSKANFVQIRPHQRVAGYHLFVIESDNTVVHFQLSKAQMAHELRALGELAHGTKAAAASHDTPEMSIRFDWTPTSGTAQRWFQRYLAPGAVPR